MHNKVYLLSIYLTGFLGILKLNKLKKYEQTFYLFPNLFIHL
jgi:hypothetical protein